MKHSPGFLSMVQEAATRVKELTLEQARERWQEASGRWWRRVGPWKSRLRIHDPVSSAYP